MLFRYARFLGMETDAGRSLDAFPDGASASDWAADALEWAAGAGLLNGRDDGSLDPAGNATRAEAASIMGRMIRLITG